MGRFLVATIGQGLWQSEDGQRWERAPGVPPDASLHALAAGPQGLLAGATGCVYVGRAAAAAWEAHPLPQAELQVWSVAARGGERPALLAGCRPLALLAADTGGTAWRPLLLALPPGTERPHTPRVTAILAERDALWCGVEVGGVFRSPDGGESWDAANDGLPSLDVHALARCDAPRLEAGALLAATPRGIARLDEAAGWQGTAWEPPWRYCRALAPLPGRPGEILCGFGDGPPGTRGGIARSEDDGRSWRAAPMPGAVASSVWSVAVDPVAPDIALAGAIGGEVFLSADGGRRWERLPRRFGELRAVLIA